MRIDRRAVLGIGTALTASTVLAQQPRVQGPPVWLDLDQRELDDAYDQSVYAFNAKNIEERRAANNAQALSAIGGPERVAYGPAEIEKVDIYKTKRPNAPTLIFIHGGGWQNGRSADFTGTPEPSVRAGAQCTRSDCD